MVFALFAMKGGGVGGREEGLGEREEARGWGE